MPEIDLDFGEKLPDEGVYRVHSDDAEYKLNKTKDGFIINLKMRMIDMPDPFEEFENLPVYDNPSLKLSARWKLREVLEAFTQDPWDEDGLKLEVVCVEDCDADLVDCPHKKIVPCLIDKDALGICYHDDYSGRLSVKISRYLADDGQVQIGPSAAA